MRFKGIDTPVRVWRLHGITGEPLHGEPQSVCRTKAEFEQFKGIVRACLAAAGGQVVYVRGDAGIGKTRLVDEMRRFAQTQGLSSHRGLVLDFGVGKGQDPVRTIVGSMLGLSPAPEPAPMPGVRRRTHRRLRGRQR